MRPEPDAEGQTMASRAVAGQAAAPGLAAPGLAAPGLSAPNLATPARAAPDPVGASAVSARFVSGSILRHVVVMSATGALGLMAIFLVDLLSLLYVSWLGDPTLTAAVGFAAILQFFAVSMNIGLMIAGGALVSRAIGAGDTAGARRIAGSIIVHTVCLAGLLVLALLPLLDPLLGLIGADEHTLPVARRFLWISLPSNLLMAAGMLFTGLLRAVGAAREAMAVTLGGAILTAIVDPLLIFGLGLGVDGAALTLCLARAAFVAIGWIGVRRYRLLARPRLATVLDDAHAVARIALPAVLTNLAPALASAFVAHLLSAYGTFAVAANVVIDRLSTVAFCGLFAMSGAIGPILGQNWGARRFDRMRAILRDGALVGAVYVVLVWIALVLARGPLTALFGLHGVAADLLGFFCLVSGPVWFFNGMLFLGNAAFNNLGFPLASTALNWGRATLGTVPPAVVGGALYGPRGVIAGVGVGSLAFGLCALLLSMRTIGTLEARARPRPEDVDAPAPGAVAPGGAEA